MVPQPPDTHSSTSIFGPSWQSWCREIPSPPHHPKKNLQTKELFLGLKSERMILTLTFEIPPGGNTGSNPAWLADCDPSAGAGTYLCWMLCNWTWSIELAYPHSSAEPSYPNLVSYANLTSMHSIPSSRPLKNIKQNWPNAEPWGMPPVSGCQLDWGPFTRALWTQQTVRLSKPWAVNFARRMLWETFY